MYPVNQSIFPRHPLPVLLIPVLGEWGRYTCFCLAETIFWIFFITKCTPVLLTLHRLFGSGNVSSKLFWSSRVHLFIFAYFHNFCESLLQLQKEAIWLDHWAAEICDQEWVVPISHTRWHSPGISTSSFLEVAGVPKLCKQTAALQRTCHTTCVLFSCFLLNKTS